MPPTFVSWADGNSNTLAQFNLIEPLQVAILWEQRMPVWAFAAYRSEDSE